MHQNPLIRANCPDPSILRVEGPDAAFYLTCTSNLNDRGPKYPIYRSRDLGHWEQVGHIFPEGCWPRWAHRDFWAPEIHRVGGRYVAYFTARDAPDLSGVLCIGVATAEHPEGPWTDLGRPLIRDGRVGMIDAHQFQDDDGQRYLYWKGDGNATDPPEPSPLYVQLLADDGVTLLGEPTEVLRNDLPWEGAVAEGPWVVKRDGRYYLFYSGEMFNSERYAVGVARAPSPRGPFDKLPEPILRGNARWVGPGHGAVVTFEGRDYYLYHAWEPGRIDAQWDVSVYPRMALLDRIEWRDGWPRIHDGTPSVEPVALF